MPKNLAAKKVKVSSKYTREEKIAIADEIVEYIRERSRKGNGPGDKKWSGKAGVYTKGYMESIDFKAAGKKKGKVDQRLSGDMLTELDVLKVSSDEIAYGYSFGHEDHGKAKGNVLGTYGKKRANTAKARDFLLLTDKELKTILSNYPLRGKDSEQTRAENVESRLKAMEALRELLVGEKQDG